MTPPRRPPIVLGALEFARLQSILGTSLRERYPEGGAQLRRTLMRATVVPTPSLPADSVVVGAQVVYREDADRRWREGRLVYPWDERRDGRSLSVLSPIGASLLGLGIGGAASWRAPSGRIYTWIVGGVCWPEARSVGRAARDDGAELELPGLH